jgi:hypothetical protein
MKALVLALAVCATSFGVLTAPASADVTYYLVSQGTVLAGPFSMNDCFKAERFYTGQGYTNLACNPSF